MLLSGNNQLKCNCDRSSTSKIIDDFSFRSMTKVGCDRISVSNMADVQLKNQQLKEREVHQVVCCCYTV